MNKFLFLAPNAWGRGDTLEEAYRNCRKELSGRARGMWRKRMKAFRVHPDSTVDPVDGRIMYPKPHQPVGIDPVTGAELPPSQIT